MAIKLNGLSGVHKGSGSIAKATLPDVCLTPTTNGPVPLNYPNTALSSDLSGGTSTIKAEGDNMYAVRGSQISKSTGGEAGTIGGVVSGTNVDKATWITSSPNIYMEGKSACRKSDKMSMNNNNTACLAGIM